MQRKKINLALKNAKQWFENIISKGKGKMHRRGKNVGDTKTKKLFSSTYMGFLCINLQKIVCTKKLEQSILEINLITSIKEKLLCPLTQKTHAMDILQGPQCWQLIIATTGTVKRTKNIIYMCAIHYNVMGLSKKQIDLYVPIRKGLQNIKWKKKEACNLSFFVIQNSNRNAS